MADSVGGGGFPTTNLQIGHIFCDRDDLTLWKFLGGEPRLASSWLLINGRVNEQPDTSLWGLAQAGAVWFHAPSRVYYGWDGVQLVPMAWRSSPSLYDYRTMMAVWDDFQQGLVASGTLGKLGWITAGTLGGLSSELNRPGLIQLTTTAVSGTICRLSPHNSTAILCEQRQDVTWIVRVNTVDANTLVRFGEGNSVAGNPPNNGAYFEKLDADTTWACVSRAGAVQTRVVTTVPVSAAFVILKMSRTASGYLFYINDVLVATITTNLPTVANITGIAPYGFIINSAAANKTVDIDYFEWIVYDLQR